MERTVSNGYRDCTVLLDGTECRVTFDHCYRAFAVMNDSTEDVFVSIEQGKSSGEDGVRRIAPGCSSVIAHMRTDVDTVYVTGSGSVQISAQNGTENPFKPQSGGGDTTINGNVVTPSAVNGNIKIDGVECRVYDDTAIKNDIPTSLPANGGNADTAGGTTTTILCCDGNPITILDWANSTNNNSHSFAIFSYGIPSDSPFSEEAVISLESDNKNERKVITWKSYTSTKVLQRRIYQGAWQTEWYNPANGCNADTVDGLDSTNFVQQHLIATSADLVNNANLRYSYETVIATDVASLVGLPSAWWHLKYMRHGYEGGYGFQMAFPLDSPNAPPMYRMALGTTWQNWQALFTTRHMPYATGTASISYSNSYHELQVLNFTPSFVICRYSQREASNGVLEYAEPIANGFKISIADATVTSIDYIAFR